MEKSIAPDISTTSRIPRSRLAAGAAGAFGLLIAGLMVLSACGATTPPPPPPALANGVITAVDQTSEADFDRPSGCPSPIANAEVALEATRRPSTSRAPAAPRATATRTPQPSSAPRATTPRATSTPRATTTTPRPTSTTRAPAPGGVVVQDCTPRFDEIETNHTFTVLNDDGTTVTVYITPEEYASHVEGDRFSGGSNTPRRLTTPTIHLT